MLITLAAALASLNPDAPALTLAQAQTMPVEVLADALLAPGYPDIVQAFAHPMGMEAPPGIGLTSIDLYAMAEPASENGFCRKVDYHVVFADEPTVNSGAVRPRRLEPLILYRLAGRSDEDYPGCEAPAEAFFRMRSAEHAAQIALLRSLAQARIDATKGKSPAFAVHFEDQTSGMTPIKTSLDAVAHLPVGRISQIGSPDRSGTIAIEAANDTWSIRVSMRDGAIADLSIQRHIPRPF